MNTGATVVALRRKGGMICRSCVLHSGEASELEIITSPDHNPKLRMEEGIEIICAADLKGHEKCTLCGRKIGTSER